MDRKTKKSKDAASTPGNQATTPSQIPRQGWIQVAKRVNTKISTHNLSIVAAGMAFYAMLAVFPLLIAIVSIYGLIANPEVVASQVTSLTQELPQGAREIIAGQLKKIAAPSQTALRWGAVLSLGGALWAASNGVLAVVTSLNIVYDENETRGFFRLRFLGLLLTLGFVGFVVTAVALVAVLPGILGRVGLGPVWEVFLAVGRWPLLAVAAGLGLAVLNRYGADRKEPQWRWVTWGNVVAVVLWLLVSYAFSYYVANFGNYNEMYGSLGGIIILLMWLYLSSFMILLGAEINAEAEHQTGRDSTVGRERPAGTRGAVKADTVPEPS